MFDTVKYFLEDFYPNCVNSCGIVDITLLFRKVRETSPKKQILKCTDLTDSFRFFAPTILSNFCINHGSRSQFFIHSGIKALADVLSNAIATEDNIAKQTLLLHATKADLLKEDAASLFRDITWLTVETDLDERLKYWQNLFMKLLKNDWMNSTIDQWITKFGLMAKPASDIEAKFVKNLNADIRGFAGLNAVYVNLNYIFEKISNYAKHINNDSLLELITALDVLNIFVHELAHVKMRLCTNDFNMSTPDLAQTKGLEVDLDHYEFGRLIEVDVFSKAVDWYDAFEVVPLAYIQSVLNAVENSIAIPKGDGFAAAKERPYPLLMAVDSIKKRSSLCS